MGSRPLLVRLAVLGIIAAACAAPTRAQHGSPRPGADPLLTLDVRVHLLHSSDSDALTTTLTGEEVELVFEGVNAVWSRAGIRWRLVSIEQAAAPNGDSYERVHRGEARRRASTVLQIIPRDRLSEDFDVFFVRHLLVAPGVYLPPLTAILQAELDPDGLRALEGGLVRILSHELGHALSLPHVPCADEGNLMSPGCFKGERTRLTQQQIDQARRQAATGRPHRGGYPSARPPDR